MFYFHMQLLSAVSTNIYVLRGSDTFTLFRRNKEKSYYSEVAVARSNFRNYLYSHFMFLLLGHGCLFKTSQRN